MNDTSYWNRAVAEYRARTGDQRDLQDVSVADLSRIARRAQELKITGVAAPVDALGDYLRASGWTESAPGSDYFRAPGGVSLLRIQLDGANGWAVYALEDAEERPRAIGVGLDKLKQFLFSGRET